MDDNAKKDVEDTIQYTWYSSFLFLTNMMIALYVSEYIYSFIFFILFSTSIYYRLNKEKLHAFYIDKSAVVLVVFYGAFVFYSKFNEIPTIHSSVIILLFLLTNYLFYYGYCTESFCYDKNPELAGIFHSILHLIASIGHHMILLS
jgi:hypothetical protein